jgi:hypothetical protein
VQKAALVETHQPATAAAEANQKSSIKKLHILLLHPVVNKEVE